MAALYGDCSLVCATCVALFVSEKKVATKLFRLGIYLFTIMNWVSSVGYSMYPLTASGHGTQSFQDVMHIVVTVLVVLLSIISLVLLIIAGCRAREVRSVGIFAFIAFMMMLVGAVGQGIVPPQYFGVVERFSVFAAVGFNAVLGLYLFKGFNQ